MTIRPIRPSDRASVERILVSTGRFTAVEVATALELIDDALARGEASGYFTFVLDLASDAVRSDVRGYVCFGPTPLTEGTYDLYWIAVGAGWQGSGYGRQLLAFAEGEVRQRGGRLLVIETSSQESYGSTIRFYERRGYLLVARVPDFFRPGDDKLIFAKRV